MREFHLGRWASERIPDQSQPTLFTMVAMFVAANVWASEAGVVASRELGVALAFAVQLALLLLLGSLLHAWRPRGPDIPPSTWIETWRRFVAPMPITMVGLLLAGGCTWVWLTKEPDNSMLILVAIGAGLASVGLLAAVYRTRHP